MRDKSIQATRRKLIAGTALSIILPACEAKKMQVYLNISLFSYLDRPVFDVLMNGTDFMGAAEHSFYGSNAVMIQQPITLGPQVVTWRLDGPEGTPRNGDTVKAKNIPVLDAVPVDVKWLALHIYDDDTVEISLSKGTATELQTVRGMMLIEQWRNTHAE